MYSRFFNLREEPFSMTPDPRFLYLSAQHEAAIESLLYGIRKTNGVSKVWIASGETAQDLQNDPSCAAADGIVKGKMPESLEKYVKNRALTL